MKKNVENADGRERKLIDGYDGVEREAEKHLGADESMPDAQQNEKDERTDGVLVERGQIGDGGQLLRDDPAKVDGGEDEQTGGGDAKVRQLARDGEGHEAENANEKDEHVGVVEVVAGTARNGRRDGETRSFVFVPRVVDVLFGDLHVRVQVPLLLLLKIVRVYCALVVAARHE